MSVRDDDTALDALAARARSSPELTADAADRLIAAARGGDLRASESLVEHSLGAVLAEAVAHRDHGVEVTDLFQEGSLAVVVAVREYVERSGAGAQLGDYVRRVVAGHLDRLVEREEAAAAEAAAIVEDTRLLEVAQVALRHQLRHEPTSTELAAVLLWPRERVALIAEMLAMARESFDSEIIEYLDDEDNAEP
jgi:DNA-directed RNA polymerase sigma subunit (sigma70/sigma32)